MMVGYESPILDVEDTKINKSGSTVKKAEVR